MRTDEHDNYDPIDPSERRLDELLERARFPLPSIDAERRLREQWTSLSRKRRSAPVRWIAAAAAVLVVVSGTVLIMLRTMIRPGREPMRIVVLPADPRLREPTLMERVVIGAERPRQRRQQQPAAAAAPDPAVDRLVRQLGDPLVDRRMEAARELGQRSDPQVVGRLAEMVRRGQSRREAIATLLFCQDPAAQQALANISRSSSAINAQVDALKRELSVGS